MPFPTETGALHADPTVMAESLQGAEGKDSLASNVDIDEQGLPTKPAMEAAENNSRRKVMLVLFVGIVAVVAIAVGFTIGIDTDGPSSLPPKALN